MSENQNDPPVGPLIPEESRNFEPQSHPNNQENANDPQNRLVPAEQNAQDIEEVLREFLPVSTNSNESGELRDGAFAGGRQSSMFGDNVLNTTGPVFNAPVIVQQKIMVITSGEQPHETQQAASPIASTTASPAAVSTHEPPTETLEPHSSSPQRHTKCEELKTKLTEKGRSIANEPSSLAKFFQNHITPVTLSTVCKPQENDDPALADRQRHIHLLEQLSGQPEREMNCKDIFTKAEESARRGARQTLHQVNQQGKQDYITKHGKIVGVVGQVGIGKTTLAKKWAVQALNEQVLGNISFFFYIVIGLLDFTEKMTFLQFLHATMYPDWECTLDEENVILNIINNDPNVLIIIDGLDEAGFQSFGNSVPLPRLHSKSMAENFLKHLAGGNLLPRARKIITSQPTQLSTLHPSYRPKFIIEVRGLTKESQNELGRQICGARYTEIQKKLEHCTNVFAHCYVPIIFVLTLNFLSTCEEVRVVSLTQILSVTFCKFSDTEHPKNAERDLHKLCKVAWERYRNQGAVFNPGHDCGFLSHPIWKEYLVAVHLMLFMPLTDFEEKCKNLTKNGWQKVAKYVYGICAQSVFDLLAFKAAPNLVTNLNVKKEFLRNLITHFPFSNDQSALMEMCSLAQEANDPEITKAVSCMLPGEIDFGNSSMVLYDVDIVSLVLCAPRYTRLKELDLSDNQVSDLGALSIARCIHNVEKLVLWSCGISSQGVKELSKAIAGLKTPILLHLSYNRIGNEGATYLALCIHNIKVLVLCGCGIGRNGIEQLSMKINNPCTQNVATNSIHAEYQMERLDLSMNTLTDESAEPLARCVHKIINLHVVECEFTEEGLTLIKSRSKGKVLH